MTCLDAIGYCIVVSQFIEIQVVPLFTCTSVISEYLSMRQLILCHIPFYVCLSVCLSCLGKLISCMQHVLSWPHQTNKLAA